MKTSKTSGSDDGAAASSSDAKPSDDSTAQAKPADAKSSDKSAGKARSATDAEPIDQADSPPPAKSSSFWRFFSFGDGVTGNKEP